MAWRDWIGLKKKETPRPPQELRKLLDLAYLEIRKINNAKKTSDALKDFFTKRGGTVRTPEVKELKRIEIKLLTLSNDLYAVKKMQEVSSKRIIEIIEGAEWLKKVAEKDLRLQQAISKQTITIQRIITRLRAYIRKQEKLQKRLGPILLKEKPKEGRPESPEYSSANVEWREKVWSSVDIGSIIRFLNSIDALLNSMADELNAEIADLKNELKKMAA